MRQSQTNFQKIGQVDSKQFLISFIQLGKKERDEKRRAFLESSREAIKRAKEEEEEKLNNQWAKAEQKVDYSFTEEDFQSAVSINLTALTFLEQSAYS